MRPESKKLLQDVLDASRSILAYVEGKAFSDYLANELIRSGVERKFITIGEALARLAKADPETVERITAARRIISFRNILTHGYDVVEDETVWGIVRKYLPQLKNDVETLLSSRDS